MQNQALHASEFNHVTIPSKQPSCGYKLMKIKGMNSKWQISIGCPKPPLPACKRQI